MMSQLTIKDTGIVVNITRETRSPSQRGFGACAFVHAVTAITDRIKRYIKADYGEGAEPYEAAKVWFGSKISPEEFYVVQALVTSEATSAASTFDLSSVPNANGDGKVGFTIGGDEYLTETSNGDTADAVGSKLAGLVNQGTKYVAASVLGEVTIVSRTPGVLGNADVLADVSTDTTMTGAVLAQPVGGADLVPDETISEALDAALAINPGFYFVAINRDYRVLDASMNSAASWVTLNERFFTGESNDIDILNDIINNDIASVFKAAGYDRCMITYSSHTIEYPGIAAVAVLATTDFTGRDTLKTLKFKDLYLISAEDISPLNLSTLHLKNTNVFYIAAEIRMYDSGVCSSGIFADEIHGSDAMAETIRVGVFGKLARVDTKVPYNEPGMAELRAEVDKALASFVTNGYLSDAVNEDGNYLPAYTTDSGRIALASVSDRSNRIAPGITFEARIASAIHKLTITGTIVLP